MLTVSASGRYDAFKIADKTVDKATYSIGWNSVRSRACCCAASTAPPSARRPCPMPSRA
jgi:hypothetical protein